MSDEYETEYANIRQHPFVVTMEKNKIEIGHTSDRFPADVDSIAGVAKMEKLLK